MGASLWHYLPRCPRWHSVLLMENHSSGPETVRVVHHDGSWRKRAQTAEAGGAEHVLVKEARKGRQMSQRWARGEEAVISV